MAMAKQPGLPIRRSGFLALLAPLLIVAILTCATQGARAEWHSSSGQAMGTEITVELWHKDAGIAQQAIEAVMAEMRRIDQTFSPWIETSELYRVNELAFQTPQPVSDELALLVDRSMYYSRLTEGAFDITFASVGWYYDYRAKQQPDDAQTEALLPAIDYHKLILDRRRNTLAFQHPDLRIDLGGIAKGYAVDQAIEILRGYGVENASVSAGGDTRLLGDRRGRPWMVGIKKPRSLSGDHEPAVVLPLQDVAISTSGDYERYFIDPDTGERVHHIINPHTGRSVHGIVSVTIIGRQSIDADALSTSVFVLGVEKGLALVNALPGIDSIIIDSSGTLHYSDGLMPPVTGPVTDALTELRGAKALPATP